MLQLETFRVNQLLMLRLSMLATTRTPMVTMYSGLVGEQSGAPSTPQQEGSATPAPSTPPTAKLNTATAENASSKLEEMFNQAQQAQQFGANLGLQGYGQALQGAGQLAGIGSQARRAASGC